MKAMYTGRCENCGQQTICARCGGEAQGIIETPYLAERPHLSDDERNRDPESGYIIHSREALAATGWRDPHRKLHDACFGARTPDCLDPLSCPTHREGYED